MEKDPQCLILTFHIVQLVAQLFPDPDGPLASVAEELFETLGRYFPIHFTHVSYLFSPLYFFLSVDLSIFHVL